MNTDNMLPMLVGVGVIEAYDDPTGLNRLKVRVFQVHDEPSKLPTEKLPWAQVILPVNDAHKFGVPYVGDWVLCTFLDGKNAQEVIVLGVIPGINSDNPKEPTQSTSEIDALKAQIAEEEKKLQNLING